MHPLGFGRLARGRIMSVSKAEKVQAERVSVAVEQLLREPGVMPQGLDPDEARTLATAQRLARLPALLGPVPPALEQQVMRRVRSTSPQPRGMIRSRLGWARSAHPIRSR